MTSATTTFYKRVSVLYPLVNFVLQPQKRRMMQEINSQPAGRLLEVGVGTGTHLKEYTHHDVTAIENSVGMFAKAAKHCPAAVKLILMDGEYLVFPDQCYDYVVLSHVLAVVDDPDRLLMEIYRVLKPGGRVFILNHFTPDNWLKYFDKGFGLVSGWLHFKSVFRIDSISAIQKFTLSKQICFGRYAYFKLLIFCKP